MSVKVAPTQHEEVDYAEMCAHLQQQLAEVEGKWAQKMHSQEEIYLHKIAELSEQVTNCFAQRKLN